MTSDNPDPIYKEFIPKPKKDKRSRLAAEKRQFPDVDKDLFMIAVMCHDEIAIMWKARNLTPADLMRLKELASLIILIKKTAPHLLDKNKKEEQHTPGKDITEDEPTPSKYKMIGD